MTTTTVPNRTEAAVYTSPTSIGPPRRYLRSPRSPVRRDPCAAARHLRRAIAMRYAPDKWSIREVVSHLNDTERLFVFRALWFARGFDSPLPSFDQNVAIAMAGADARPGAATWKSSGRSVPRRWRSSRIFRPTPGRGAASPVEIRSRSGRSPILRRGTSATTRKSSANDICRIRRATFDGTSATSDPIAC